MKITLTIIEYTLMLILTIALYLDFFPHPYLPKWFSVTPWVVLIMLIIASILNKKLDEDKDQNKFSKYTLIYIIALIVVFSLAGGESQSGLSLSEPTIWIAFAISFFIDRKIIYVNRNHQ